MTIDTLIPVISEKKKLTTGRLINSISSLTFSAQHTN
jgi:hypothetical protein